MDEMQYTEWILLLSNQIKRNLNEASNNQGTQMRILNFVLDNYQEKEIYQKDIQKIFNIRRATVSMLLKKMEDSGLIIRESVECDERIKRIRPTPQAIVLQKKIKKNILGIEEELIMGIEKEELDIFSRVTQKMISNMSG